MKKRREQSVDGRLDYAASQIAVALRNTLRKYGSFVDELIKIQRVVEDARSIHQSLYHAIDGKVCDMLTYYNARVTPPNSFVGQLYSAITNTSVRKWTRQHVELVMKSVSEKESVERKIGKLRERAALEKPGTPEATATATMLARQCEARAVLARRIDFTVRKFLELRQCALQSLIGATNTLYVVVGNDVQQDVLRDYSTRRFMDELSDADDRAIRHSTRKKGS